MSRSVKNLMWLDTSSLRIAENADLNVGIFLCLEQLIAPFDISNT